MYARSWAHIWRTCVQLFAFQILHEHFSLMRLQIRVKVGGHIREALRSGPGATTTASSVWLQTLLVSQVPSSKSLISLAILLKNKATLTVSVFSQLPLIKLMFFWAFHVLAGPCFCLQPPFIPHCSLIMYKFLCHEHLLMFL